mmetsp:Transcript_40210/g.115556  ORF Transcript_40210/g.115556 Transcript_40210/m.115556 type:complete len:87 (+) Transcript_40210:138-398(+)
MALGFGITSLEAKRTLLSASQLDSTWLATNWPYRTDPFSWYIVALRGTRREFSGDEASANSEGMHPTEAKTSEAPIRLTWCGCTPW